MTATIERTTQDVNVGTMRFTRQSDILKGEVCDKPIHIIGAGATGSFTALALAKMGMTNITIYDKDSVEEHNFPNQLFPIRCKGMNKALAVKEIVKEYTGTEINAIPEFFTGKEELTGIVISALDSMKGRKLIFKSVKNNQKVELLIDPRTGPELFTILTVDNRLDSMKDLYAETLVKDSDVLATPCTARAIIYSVLAVSAFISNQVKRYLMNQTYKYDTVIDMNEHLAYFGD